MRTRHAARLIVVSPDDRVLLFRWMDDVEIHDPARPGASTYWNTPGGGIEAVKRPRTPLGESCSRRPAHAMPTLDRACGRPNASSALLVGRCFFRRRISS